MKIPKESFSPESGGREKARMAMEEMRMHGMIRLKKLKIFICSILIHFILYLSNKDARD